jgi:hypothetical protein
MLALERKVFNFMQGNIQDTKIHYLEGGGGAGEVFTVKSGGMCNNHRVLED